ncbi:MAG: OsmC family protein [Bdellovibrionales bacterium]
MVKSTFVYQGQLHCEIKHGPSGNKIETDAPKDNQGKGEKFSPTDLVGAALGSCVLTTMAIVAERDGVSLEGSTASVEKNMLDKPRRIGSLVMQLNLPAKLTPEQRRKLEETAKHCPVHRSLHPDLQMPMTFSYTL